MSQRFLVRRGGDGRPRPTLLLIGSGPIAEGQTLTDAESARPDVACPLCGRAVPHPVVVRGGSRSLAECADCDVYFEAEPVKRTQRETDA